MYLQRFPFNAPYMDVVSSTVRPDERAEAQTACTVCSPTSNGKKVQTEDSSKRALMNLRDRVKETYSDLVSVLYRIGKKDGIVRWWHSFLTSDLCH